VPPSNEHILVVRAPGAQGHTDASPSSLPHPLLHKRTRATVMLSLRASNEGLLRGNRCVLAHRGWAGEKIRVARADLSSFFSPHRC
jgi:hypothetical protein